MEDPRPVVMISIEEYNRLRSIDTAIKNSADSYYLYTGSMIFGYESYIMKPIKRDEVIEKLMSENKLIKDKHDKLSARLIELQPKKSFWNYFS